MGRREAVAGVVAAVCVAAGTAAWWYARQPRDGGVAIDAVVVTDERVLTVEVLTGVAPCDSALRVSVDETDDLVRLTARVRHDPRATCPALGQRHVRQVTLSAPLGDRPVRDGHADRGIVVSGRR